MKTQLARFAKQLREDGVNQRHITLWGWRFGNWADTMKLSKSLKKPEI
jgi:hypothetical protein